MSRSALRPAQRTSTEKSLGLRRMTFSVWVPIEPVEPKMAIFFIKDGKARMIRERKREQG